MIDAAEHCLNPECGTSLIGRSPRAKYCSPECRSRYSYARILAQRVADGFVSPHTPHVKTCAGCSDPFVSQRKIQTRCPDCQKELLIARRRRGPAAIPATCTVCEKPFTADRWNAKVCPDPECRAEQKRRLANSLTQGRLTFGHAARQCAVCEIEFHGHPNSLACSRKCRLARLRELTRRRLNIETYHCISCGGEIPPDKNGRVYRYTCSEDCRYQAMSAKNRRAQAARNRDRFQAELADLETQLKQRNPS